VSADDVFPLPRDRNGKVIRFGDAVMTDRDGPVVIDAIKCYADGHVFVFGGEESYHPRHCVVVEEPFSERFKPGDIVAAPRFGGDPLRVIGWVPERNGYAAVWLEESRSLTGIYEPDNPTLVERAS
jgi:hypothetical protein